MEIHVVFWNSEDAEVCLVLILTFLFIWILLCHALIGFVGGSEPTFHICRIRYYPKKRAKNTGRIDPEHVQNKKPYHNNGIIVGYFKLFGQTWNSVRNLKFSALHCIITRLKPKSFVSSSSSLMDCKRFAPQVPGLGGVTAGMWPAHQASRPAHVPYCGEQLTERSAYWCARECLRLRA